VCCGHSQALPPVQLRTDSQLIQCCVVYVQEGGLNGFMHCFLAEVMAICRAHVAALGGNALVAFQLTECIIEDNVHKNQVTITVSVVVDCFVIFNVISRSLSLSFHLHSSIVAQC